MLNSIDLEIKAGTVHAILAPPGHGKSALLKAIAGLLPHSDITDGQVLFSSDSSQGWVTQQQLQENSGSHGALNKLVAFVDQVDFHYPRLTVQEVLLEAAQLTNAHLPQEDASAYEARLASRVQEVIQLLGLTEAANTIVGDSSLRGISGGQRRRLSLGEMLVTPARVILADQITDGLDSSTARDIMQSLAKWAHTTGAVVVTTVNQPTPEVLATTDGVVLLREGSVVFSGPFDSIQQYFTEVLHLAVPGDMDIADFAIELLSDAGFVSVRYRRTTPQDSAPAPLPPPSNTKQLVDAFAAWGGSVGTVDAAGSDKMATGALLSGDAQVTTFGSQYAHSWGALLGMQLSRQWSMLIRNTRFLGVRVFQQIVIGLILGSLFYDLGPDDFLFRVGLLAFVPPHLGFTAIGELPLYIEFKKPVSKQRNAGFYPSSVYVIAGLLVLLPLALLDLVLLSSLLLPLTGIQGSAEQAFFFILLHFLFVVAISAQFRAIAFFAPNLEAAQVMAAPVTGTYSLANGFVGRSVLSMGGIGLAVYWLSPMSWMLRSSAHMEFLHSDDYTRQAGEAILQSLDIQTEDGWLWGGVGYVIVFAAQWIVLALISFDKNNRNLNIGKQRPELIQAARLADAAAEGKQPATFTAVVDIEMTTVATQDGAAMPAPVAALGGASSGVVPSSSAHGDTTAHETVLTWEGINYTVDTKQGPKQLLHDITGFAQGGQLTALMGATGAGKSTLSDVLLLRKTTGVITGDLYLNGVRVAPEDKAGFVRQTGYVEQFDEINPLQTVAEVVRFAADLRLPAATTADERAATVKRVLGLLDLDVIAARAVGVPGIHGALSQSERKRLAIAQEIVARPRVLLLDEPTTGLDAKAAREVLEVVKMAALAWGMVVICTIHAPSAELFFEFDNLLLLAPGGHTAYFGVIASQEAPVERSGFAAPAGRAAALQRYLETVPGVAALPPTTNPASWMMDAVNADVAAGASATAEKLPSKDATEGEADPESVQTPPAEPVTTPDVAKTAGATQLWQVWATSDKAADTKAFVESIRTKVAGGAAAPQPAADLPGAWMQLRVLVARTWATFARNIDYNTERSMISIIMGFVFGAVFTDGGLDNEKETISGVISQLGLTFNALIFILFPNLLAVNVSFFQERSSFYREHGDMKLYSAWVFVLGRFLVETVYIAGTTLAFVTPLYWIAGLRADVGVFLHFWFVGYLIALAFSMVGLQSANQFATLEVSSLQGSFGARILLAFGGLFIGRDQMPSAWRWLHDISPLSNAQKAIAGPQFGCLQDEPLGDQRACALITMPTSAGVPVTVPAEAFVGSVYDVFPDQQWERTLYTVIPVFIILGLTMITFATKRHNKR